MNQIPSAGLVKAGKSEKANVARVGFGILRTKKIGIVGCLQVFRLGLAAVIEIRPLIVVLGTQSQHIGIVAIDVFLFLGELACYEAVPIFRKIPLSKVIENFHNMETDL